MFPLANDFFATFRHVVSKNPAKVTIFEIWKNVKYVFWNTVANYAPGTPCTTDLSSLDVRRKLGRRNH